MPAETPAGLAYRLRERGSQLSQSMCWEVTGRSKTKENIEPTAYRNLIDVEYRSASPVPFQLFPANLLHGRHACTALLCNWKVLITRKEVMREWRPLTCTTALLKGHASSSCEQCVSASRLQACEDTQAVMAEDLESLRGLGSQLSSWRNQMEEASSQVATVLNLVESDASEFRCSLFSPLRECTVPNIELAFRKPAGW